MPLNSPYAMLERIRCETPFIWLFESLFQQVANADCAGRRGKREILSSWSVFGLVHWLGPVQQSTAKHKVTLLGRQE